MSPHPDAMEWVVHGLDIGYGLACLWFAVVAVHAVAAEVRLRRRLGAPLFGPLPAREA